MPYITASIIMQVLGVVIPKLEKLQQEGAVGQRKITQYTRYLAIGIATLQATALTFIFGNGNGNAFFGAAQRLPQNVKLLSDGMWPRGYLVILTLVGGTAALMWIGELISQRGIGNGMSMIIFASVVSRLPFGYYAISPGDELDPVRAAGGHEHRHRHRRREGRARPAAHPRAVRQTCGRSAHVRRPEHLHPAEGEPERRRAHHLRQLHPAAARAAHQPVGRQRRHRAGGPAIQRWVDTHLVNSQNWVYITLFSLMIIAFAYFYNSIAFDPIRQADQIRRQGGFIPGVRPGPQTERYLSKAVNRITLPGAVFVAFIAIMPYLLLWAFGVQNFPFAGTTVLIAVGVALELMRQIDSQLMLRNYEGFLK